MSCRALDEMNKKVILRASVRGGKEIVVRTG